MSPPPYELRDKATGLVVPNFEDMDTAPGRFIEVYSGAADGNPDTRISGGALERPADGEPVDPPDPPIDPIPPTGGNGMDEVSNETELRDALMTYANEQRFGVVYSRVPIAMTRTIEIRQEHHDGAPWGANLNFMRLNWTGPGGDDMLRFRGINGVANRCLQIEKVVLFGNGYSGAPAGACFKIYAPDGDPGCYYKFTLRDIHTSYATNGIVLSGAVFEGMVDNCHAENHTGDGFLFEHLNVGSATQAIVSNIALLHPNSSRNFGAGVRQAYSVNSIFGSYVLNAEGGIVAPDGLRRALASNGENTGEAVFVIGHNGYGSLVDGCEASTNCTTVARKYENGQWVDVGKPLRYLIDDNGVGVPQAGNHVSTYGGDGDVAVVKP